MYLTKELGRGYNSYIDTAVDDLGTQMDVGLLVMEPGDTFTVLEPEKETALLLFSGHVTYRWEDHTVDAVRPDCFHYEAYCLLAGRDTEVTLTALDHTEVYVQKTINPRTYPAVMYTPDTIQTQHAGANGELMGCMRREIKTFFD